MQSRGTVSPLSASRGTASPLSASPLTISRQPSTSSVYSQFQVPTPPSLARYGQFSESSSSKGDSQGTCDFEIGANEGGELARDPLVGSQAARCLILNAHIEHRPARGQYAVRVAVAVVLMTTLLVIWALILWYRVRHERPPGFFSGGGSQDARDSCCEALTAECLACVVGVTVDRYCAESAHTEIAGCREVNTENERHHHSAANHWGKDLHESSGAPRYDGCCTAESAECLACLAGQSVDDYCSRNSAKPGCWEECCDAEVAQCFACAARLSVGEYCGLIHEDGSVDGCEHPAHRRRDPASCCREEAADCMSCSVDVSIEEFCGRRANYNMTGCDGFCGFIEDSTLYKGGTLRIVNDVTSEEACCGHCRREPRCTSWSWGRGQDQLYSRKCYLKSQAELKRLPDRGFTSGLPGKDTTRWLIRNRAGSHLCLTSERDTVRPLLRPCPDADARNPPNEGQKWSYNRRTGRLMSASGKCLSAGVEEGAQVLLQPCGIGFAAQRWRHTGADGLIRRSAADGVGEQAPAGGNLATLCLAVDGAERFDSGLKTRPCDAGMPSQQWGFWNTDLLAQAASREAMKSEAREDKLREVATTSTLTSVTTSTTVPPIPRNVSLLCFSLMLPWGYEPGLLQMQSEHHISIFACQESAVYTNLRMNIGTLVTRVVEVDLHCPIGGKFMTALNTPIFRKLWEQVIRDGRYKHHEWTIKVDPDAVFMPHRLINIVKVHLKDELEGGKGILLNNCRFGMHGPIEVVTRKALDSYAKGWWKCAQPPQEDVYLRRCLVLLGVSVVDHFDLLAEDHCESKGWAQCEIMAASFHPFKTTEGYLQCLASARQIG